MRNSLRKKNTSKLEAQNPVLSFLTFKVQQKVFAIQVKVVQEIISYEEHTELPLAPLYVHGLINLREKSIPVIDLGAYFYHQITQVNKKSCILILDAYQKNQSQKIGILVDSVCEVVEVESQKVEAPPLLGSQHQSDFLQGMIRIQDHLILVLDEVKIQNLDYFLTESLTSSISLKTETLDYGTF